MFGELPLQEMPFLSKKVKESPPVCGEHVHTGRLDTQINNSHYKKSNVMSILNVYLEKLKIEKEKPHQK